MKNPATENCGNCYYGRTASTEGTYTCRFNAPGPIAGNIRWPEWPKVAVSDWCGKWEQRWEAQPTKTEENP